MKMALDTRRLGSKGEAAFANMEKINAELFVMTYGAIVIQLIKDLRDIDKVNTKLESMGYSMGTRLVDEFLAKSQIRNCKNFKQTAELIARVGFKMFLGVEGNVKKTNDEVSFVLQIPNNPLNDFVELPPKFRKKLIYCNVLCGVIRGALEMVQLRVSCEYLSSVLSGDEVDEIKVTLEEVLEEVFEEGE